MAHLNPDSLAAEKDALAGIQAATACEAYQHGCFAQASRIMAAYLKARPDDHDAWIKQGDFLACDGQSAESLLAYQQAARRGAPLEKVARQISRVQSAAPDDTPQPDSLPSGLQPLLSAAQEAWQKEQAAFQENFPARRQHYDTVLRATAQKQLDLLIIVPPYLDFAPGYPPYGLEVLLHYLEKAGKKAAPLDLNLAMYEAAGPLQRLWKSSETDKWLDPFALQMDILPLFSLDVAFLAKHIADLPSRALGFSCFQVNRFCVRELLARLGETDNHPPIFLGGPDCFYPDLCQMRYGDLAGCITGIATGEGEKTIEEVLENLEQPAMLKGIPGLLYMAEKENVQKESETHAMASPVHQRDLGGFYRFPRAYIESIPEPRKKLIATSRGCANHCDFCYDWKAWQRFRMRTMEDVAEEIAWYHGEYGYTAFHFVDSATNASPRHLEALCDLLIEKALPVTIDTSMMVSPQMTADLFHKMQAAGFREMYYGLETGSRRVMEAMGKRGDPEEASRNLRLSAEAGLYNRIFLIVGHPAENLEAFEETKAFLRHNRRWIQNLGMINVAQILRHTRLEELAARQGVTIPEGWPSTASWSLGDNTIFERNRRREELLSLVEALGIERTSQMYLSDASAGRTSPWRMLLRKIKQVLGTASIL